MESVFVNKLAETSTPMSKASLCDRGRLKSTWSTNMGSKSPRTSSTRWPTVCILVLGIGRFKVRLSLLFVTTIWLWVAWILIEQAFKNPPFRISEQGWGEFDMQIILTAADKDHTVTHDLNFAQPRYESKHVLVRTHVFFFFSWKGMDKELIAKKK